MTQFQNYVRSGAAAGSVRPGRHGLRIWALLALFALFGVRAHAEVHPVPLDKNVDAAKCLECHEDKTKGKAVHSAMAMGCLSCHEVRVNKEVTRVKLITATPSALCVTCHAPAKDGKVVLTQADSKSLCLTCHDDKGKLIDSAKVPHPGAMGDCTECHSPHAASQPGLPKTDSVSICLGCHSDINDLLKKPEHHQPAFSQGCATCHTPHGGENDHLLRAKGNDLCLECHGPDARPQKLEAEKMYTIFKGTVKLPDDYYTKNRVPVLPLRFGLGHPVEYHPVSDVMDPTDNSKVKTPLSCLTCHQPHASAKPNLLVKDQANNMAFCDNCHKNRLNMSETTLPAAVLEKK